MSMVLLVKFVCWLALAATATAAALIEKCSAKKPLAPFLLQARSQQSKLESNHSNYTFVHIPKTAGTEIENTLLKFGFEEGHYAHWRGEPPYALSQSFYYNKLFTKCSPWHIPPAQHVHGGWTIVREPIDRTLSEFCYSLARVDDRGAGGTVSHPPCSHCSNKHFTLDCVGLNSWVEAVLNSYSHSPWVNDCHMLPQWMYASKVDHVFSFQKLDDEEWPRIKTMYGLPANTYLEHMAMRGYELCKDTVLKPGCLSDQSTTLLKRHFHEDYEYFQSAGHFGPNPKH